MKSYGIEIRPYLKGKITIPIGGQINYRNHRKIVVIDGKDRIYRWNKYR